LRARIWAVGGGVLAAAALVGGVVVVAKVKSQNAALASRHPGISAEPLSNVRDHELNDHELNDQPSPAEHDGQLRAESQHEDAPRSVFTWRTSMAGASDVRSPNQANGIQLDQRLEAASEPILLELSGRNRATVGRVEFGLGSRVRVVRVDAAELAVDLEQGTVEAALAPRASRMLVLAGPYVVRPLKNDSAADSEATAAEATAAEATAADTEATAAYGVQWAPRAGALRVEVTRGDIEVAVAGSSERHVVAAGKSLNLVVPDSNEHAADQANGEREPTQTRLSDHRVSDLRAGATLPEPPAVKPVAPEQTAETAVVSAPPSVASTDSSQWRKFAENGQYAVAVKAAERVGFGTLEQNASASDLLLLADVARLGGAPQRARSVLTALRSRYPSHTNSAVAAFTLGRMAQEQEHDDRRAIQWYRTYLKEEPKGRMAEGARARLLKATLRIGSPAERDQAARDYLASHPTGSSAAVARSVLSK
jgi:hypothetical protein